MHLDILIDASGSMGIMKGTEFENKYLIDEQHTRTDLVKKILISSLLPKLDFVDTISIETFLNRKKLDSEGNPIIKNKRYVEYPDLTTQYSYTYDKFKLLNSIKKIDNPEPGGTPLRRSLLYKINHSASLNHHIVIFSDGEGYWEGKIDKNWHIVISNLLKKLKKNIVIHFVGISQTEDIQKQCENICSETKGTYTNLISMNYEVSQLNSLLFNLKSNITSDALKLNISSFAKNSNIDTVIQEASNNDKNPNNKLNAESNLNLQVLRNTKSLELITNQLDNIVNLLNSKTEVLHNITIDENTELNNKIGRLAEEFLYKELSKSNWKVNWLNKDQEQFMPYDFEISDGNSTYYYECKGTINNMSEFFLTNKEWLFYLENKGKYRLCFVNNVISNPTYVRFMDLLEDMKDGKLIPYTHRNIKLKADRIIFTSKLL
ncbi:protein NO VEIN domain-containing protein [Flavobacterium litorale]|uniref:DUF3883 domain-containing protein n=1 Tax=Flavobacterium litorale TaxID=2856519 RepID=A0ABX8V7M7_9FLAO|nr:DUF3883 domain-containing protein [Flavobacterium litorale]QYJ68849.1 DUF3883 domain-containing protein [Flavobacterium litorale]